MERKNMKNIVRIYKMIIKYWGFLLLNLLFMLCYALFSGVSITMVSPLLDFVFVTTDRVITIETFTEFSGSLTRTISQFLSHTSLSLNKDELMPLLNELKEVFSQTDPVLVLWIISVSFIALILLKNLFFFLNRLMTVNLKGLTVRDLRDMLFDKYISLSLKFLNKNRIGDALVRMVSDSQIICEQYVGSIFNILRNLFLIFIFILHSSFFEYKTFFN
jgi:ABC-type multidrug transport system fused ATPase/permease subunit